MSINRRTFLGQVAAGTLLSTASSRAAAHQIERLGVQLYTVRDLMAKDFEGTLAKVASLGYQEVEFAGYFDQTPANVRAILDRHKLTAPSAHIDYPSLGEKLPQIIDASRIIGHRYLVNPWIDEEMRKQPDVWKRVAEAFNRVTASAVRPRSANSSASGVSCDTPAAPCTLRPMTAASAASRV